MMEKENLENLRTTDETLVEKCNSWLERCTLDDCDTLSTSSCSDLTSVSDRTDYIFNGDDVLISDTVIQTSKVQSPVNLETIFNKTTKNFENIQIYKSKKVHIGDVTYITGPVIVKQVSRKNSRTKALDHQDFPVISRRDWLAQPPLIDRIYLKSPAKFVIITHSATEEGHTQADNTLLVRLIQTFHIESRKWDDIAYNFLIGCDGTIFEGRGWHVEGSHTLTYNRFSIAICFVGCFLKHTPPKIALEKAKVLIGYGVKIGAIEPDYSLLGHCQCYATESPGSALYEEIQTWDHWDGSIDVNNPPKIILDSLKAKCNDTTISPI